MFVKVTPEANYVQGTPDPTDLSAITDPKIIGQVPLNNPPIVTPSLFNANIGAYRARMHKGATLATYGITYQNADGTELATGAVPADIANGELTLEIVVPTEQQD
jgi:hypothetical protein